MFDSAMSRRVQTCLAVGLTLGFLAISCAVGPALPDVTPSAELKVGVAWFDDGDGRIDADEAPGEGLNVSIGQDTFRIGAAVTSDERGGFVLDLADLGLEPADDYFVEASMLVPGPAGPPVTVSYRQPVDTDDSQPVMVPLPVVAPCEHALVESVADPSLCGVVGLPDLTPLVDNADMPPTSQIATESARIDLETRPGSVLLRFASATANLGTGSLHMIPDIEPTEKGLRTWQRIWTDTYRYLDIQTGEFVFHQGHDHFHLSAFEQYRLLTLEGVEVAVGEKISFCLIDSLDIAPGPPERGFGIFPELACESAGEQQVLNVGWADYYGASLPDQWIDVTGVAPGDYLVEIIVDPDNILVEADETNNRGTFPVTLLPEDVAG